MDEINTVLEEFFLINFNDKEDTLLAEYFFKLLDEFPCRAASIKWAEYVDVDEWHVIQRLIDACKSEGYQ